MDNFETVVYAVAEKQFKAAGLETKRTGVGVLLICHPGTDLVFSNLRARDNGQFAQPAIDAIIQDWHVLRESSKPKPRATKVPTIEPIEDADVRTDTMIMTSLASLCYAMEFFAHVVHAKSPVAGVEEIANMMRKHGDNLVAVLQSRERQRRNARNPDKPVHADDN